MGDRLHSKPRARLAKTALRTAVIEYRNQGQSQQRITNHLGYSRSYIRKLIEKDSGTVRVGPSQTLGPIMEPEIPVNQEYSVPELQQVMEAVQIDCQKLVKFEKEEIRNQIVGDLQIERRLYLNAIILLGANPMAVLNSSKTRHVKQYISSLQLLNSVIYKNIQALMKIYGLNAEKNADLDIFDIDFIAAARAGGVDITVFDNIK